jgi:hypothetical protein
MNVYWTFWLLIFLPASFGLGEAYAVWKGKTALSLHLEFNRCMAATRVACRRHHLSSRPSFLWGGIVCFGR